MADVFEPLIEQLSKGARIAYSALRSFAASTLPKTEIFSQLRDAGYSFRTQTASDIIDLLRDRADVSQFIRTFGPDATIPDALHKAERIITFSEGATHQYLVGTNSANPLIPEAIYVNSDRPLSESEIFAKAAGSFKYEEGSGLAPDDLSDAVFTVDDARWLPGELI